jgi:hypothetical protein
MKMLRLLSAAAFAAALMFSLAQAEEGKKKEAKAPAKPACCLKAEKEGKKCEKACCVAAAKENKACQKCLDAEKATKAEKKKEKKEKK